MNKTLFAVFLSALSSLTYAQTCPTVDQLLVKSGDGYDVVIPAGWQTSYRGKIKNHVDSSDIAFIQADYADPNLFPSDYTNHVGCYYGNPASSSDFDIVIETARVVKEGEVANHAAWSKKAHYYYYLCKATAGNDVASCAFG